MLEALKGETLRLDHGLYPRQGLGPKDAGVPHSRIKIHQYGHDDAGLSRTLSQGLDLDKLSTTSVRSAPLRGARSCDLTLGGQHRRGYEQGPHPGLAITASRGFATQSPRAPAAR